MSAWGQSLVTFEASEATFLSVARRMKPGEGIDGWMARMGLADSLPVTTPTSTGPVGKYTCRFLDHPVTADTLGTLFAEFIDALHAVAPEAVEALSRSRARTRAYVARTALEVHGRNDLPTIRCRCGWFVSANVGREDTRRAMRVACAAAGLTWGRDVILNW